VSTGRDAAVRRDEVGIVEPRPRIDTMKAAVSRGREPAADSRGRERIVVEEHAMPVCAPSDTVV
jgi:hypothetical protein